VVNGKQLELVKGLGAWATMAMVVGHIIGTGVFLKPREMAEATHSVGLIFVVWVVGGALSLAGALTVAELGAAMPQAGGPYVYLTRGLGPRWGFLFGWMNNLIGKPSSISTIAAGFLIFLSFFLPGIKQVIFTLSIPVPGAAEPYIFNFTWAQPLAAVAILFMTFINYLGVRLAGQLQVVLTTIKVGSILAVVLLGFLLAKPGDPSALPVFPASFSAGLLSGFFVAMAGALWAYDGWIDITYAGSEVQNPQKNIPRAVVGGTVIVGGIYMLANAIYFYVLPVETVAKVQNVASETVRVFAGPGAAAWITAAMVVSAFTTLNSSILTGARVPYAMAQQGLFFRNTGTIHPSYRTPAGALVFQGVMASLMVLTGQFDELANLYIFVQWIFYALTVASVFGLRKREPNLKRPYRAWGYPVLPILFILGALGLTVSLFLNMPGRSTLGLAIMLSGLIFYERWSKSQATADVGRAKPSS
jgi:APA family basic amino acid/polyamine antiporter